MANADTNERRLNKGKLPFDAAPSSAAAVPSRDLVARWGGGADGGDVRRTDRLATGSWGAGPDCGLGPAERQLAGGGLAQSSTNVRFSLDVLRGPR